MASCTSSSAFLDVDDENAAAIISVQLEVIANELSRLRIFRAADFDTEASLLAQKAELERSAAVLKDCLMTESIRTAVIADGLVIEKLLSEDEAEVRDRGVALELGGVEAVTEADGPLYQSDRAIKVMVRAVPLIPMPALENELTPSSQFCMFKSRI